MPWHQKHSRCQWWFAIDKLAIHSSLLVEKMSFLRFNKAFLCFLVILPFSVRYFLFWAIISFFGREGEGQATTCKKICLPWAIFALLVPPWGTLFWCMYSFWSITDTVPFYSIRCVTHNTDAFMWLLIRIYFYSQFIQILFFSKKKTKWHSTRIADQTC